MGEDDRTCTCEVCGEHFETEADLRDHLDSIGIVR
jgi:hypothetical protein